MRPKPGRSAGAGLTVLFGLSLAIGVADARAEDALDRVKAAGVLTVEPAALGPPFDALADGQHVGFDADLLGEVGKEMGVAVRWRATGAGPSSGPDGAVAGPVPLTRAAMQRRRALPPLVEVSAALLKRRGDGAVLKPADIAGKAAGGVRASASLAELRAFARTLPARIAIRDHAGAGEVYADLVAGRVAALAEALATLAVVSKARPETFEVVVPPFGPRSYLGFVVAQDADHATLADALATAILKIKSDGRLSALQVKWFGMAFDTPDAVP